MSYTDKETLGISVKAQASKIISWKRLNVVTLPLSCTALALGSVHSSFLDDVLGVIRLFFKTVHNSAFVAKNNAALFMNFTASSDRPKAVPEVHWSGDNNLCFADSCKRQAFVTHTSRLEMTHNLSESVITNLHVHYHVMLRLGQGGVLKDVLVILKWVNYYLGTYACKVCVLLN